MPEPMISPASKLFVMGRRTAMVQASRIGLAAKQAVTKPIVKALVKRKAAKVAAKKAAEAKVRAQERARAERAERRKLLEQNKKKAGTGDKAPKSMPDIGKMMEDAKNLKRAKNLDRGTKLLYMGRRNWEYNEKKNPNYIQEKYTGKKMKANAK